VVCLTKYGIISLIYAAATIILAYLTATTGDYKTAMAIPLGSAAFYLITKYTKPKDCGATLIFAAGYFAAAIAYILLIAKSGGLKAYIYYAAYLTTTLIYVAVFRTIEC
jgi:hypothetical protein